MVSFYSPPKKQLSGQTIKLTIDALDAFGQGIARYQGKTVFVKNALPAEQVEVKLTEDKKQYAKARVIKYCITSEQRLKPKCQHYGICGGCDMQHLPIPQQHQIKRQALANLFCKETNQVIDPTLIETICANAYQYRRRARLAIMFENDKLVIGFRKSESKQIVDIQSCPVLVSQLESLLIPLKQCLYQIKNKRALGHIELIHVDSGTLIVLRHIKPLNEHDINLLTDFALQHQVSLYLHGHDLVHLIGQPRHFYQIDKLTLEFSPLDFIQINGDVNLKMIAQAIDWLALKQSDHVLDLFCGMGNFSLPIARHSQSVIGVEGVTSLVEKAKANVIANKSQFNSEINFFVSDLDIADFSPVWYTNNINKVLLDPARLGAYQVVETIIKHQPEKVVYISCNPATLVRDSKKLLNAGYQIEKIAVLDMFPQTKHIESMLLFTKLGTK